MTGSRAGRLRASGVVACVRSVADACQGDRRMCHEAVRRRNWPKCTGWANLPIRSEEEPKKVTPYSDCADRTEDGHYRDSHERHEQDRREKHQDELPDHGSTAHPGFFQRVLTTSIRVHPASHDTPVNQIPVNNPNMNSTPTRAISRSAEIRVPDRNVPATELTTANESTIEPAFNDCLPIAANLSELTGPWTGRAHGGGTRFPWASCSSPIPYRLHRRRSPPSGETV